MVNTSHARGQRARYHKYSGTGMPALIFLTSEQKNTFILGGRLNKNEEIQHAYSKGNHLETNAHRSFMYCLKLNID